MSSHYVWAGDDLNNVIYKGLTVTRLDSWVGVSRKLLTCSPCMCSGKMIWVVQYKLWESLNFCVSSRVRETHKSLLNPIWPLMTTSIATSICLIFFKKGKRIGSSELLGFILLMQSFVCGLSLARSPITYVHNAG